MRWKNGKGFHLLGLVFHPNTFFTFFRDRTCKLLMPCFIFSEKFLYFFSLNRTKLSMGYRSECSAPANCLLLPPIFLSFECNWRGQLKMPLTVILPPVDSTLVGCYLLVGISVPGRRIRSLHPLG